MVHPRCDIYSAPLSPTAPRRRRSAPRLVDPVHPPHAGPMSRFAPLRRRRAHFSRACPTDRPYVGRRSRIPPAPPGGGGEETKSTVLLLPQNDGYLRRWCHACRT